MTAFSRQSSQHDWGNLVWEIRAVNHRFLDMSIRLPESLRGLEPAVRELLSSKCQRGKVEASLRLVGQNAEPSLNETAIKQLASASEKIRKYFPSAQADLVSVLTWPGILENQSNKNQEVINQQALTLLETAINDLVQMRQREGAQIQTFIQQRLDIIMELVQKIQQQTPQLLALEQERMIKRLANLKVDVDQQRIMQEVAIIIHKTDIEEETQRLNSHCQAMSQTLKQVGAVGRRLDFLSQELHREANTLSSKALDISLTHSSVEMKVLIEQIREQVQNLE